VNQDALRVLSRLQRNGYDLELLPTIDGRHAPIPAVCDTS
jgi:hypothetical protein